jgi:hypothetical protein
MKRYKSKQYKDLFANICLAETLPEGYNGSTARVRPARLIPDPFEIDSAAFRWA